MKIIALSVRPGILERIKAVAPEAQVVPCSTKEELEANIGDADVLVGWGNIMTPQLLTQARKLSWIHVFMAGVDSLVSPELSATPAVLTNSRGVHAIPIGEHVTAMMLAFERGLPTLLRQQLEHRWNRLKLRELNGGTLGLVGYGGLGHEIAWRAQALGMKVIAVRKNPKPGDEVETWPLERLTDLFATADHIVACIPLTKESRHLIGERQFQAMKPDAYFYNVGRGPVVDEAALIAALREKRLAGAGLDVFEDEPLPADSPLWDMPNVIVSPHNSPSTPRQDERVAALFLENLRRYRAGEPLLNVVDKTAGY